MNCDFRNVLILLTMFLKLIPKPIFIRAIILFSISIVMLSNSLLLFTTNSSTFIMWDMLSINSSYITIPVIFDPWGILFSSVVCFISANVILFSNSYIKSEKPLIRFIHLVLLFVLSINLLIFIPRIISLLLGWDGLGLVRFILVIYYQNNKSLAAGIITALTNRVGDVLILLRIGWTVSQGHWLILNIWYRVLHINNVIIILLIFAAITKSAQVPFSSWLPAAIAAPTPVSALVHSSTLVTAGVFILLRFYPFLAKFHIFNILLLIFGSITILIAGMAAIAEVDIKKIIALSTLRQLGVIITRLRLGLTLLTFFHLITHALFKALLFICAGSLINLHHHSQDIRNIGNSINSLPSTISSLLIANIALCGFPFLAGFYSKDAIIESSLFISWNPIIRYIFIFSTALTAAYSTRFIISVNLGFPSSLPTSPINDTDTYITNPTFNLTLGAILAGSITNWLSLTPTQEIPLSLMQKTSALIVTLAGLYLAINLSKIKISCKNPLYSIFPKIHISLVYMWLLVSLSTQKILNFPFKLSLSSIKSLDQGWYEIWGPQGVFTSLSAVSSSIILFQKETINKILIISSLIYLISMLIY